MFDPPIQFNIFLFHVPNHVSPFSFFNPYPSPVHFPRHFIFAVPPPVPHYTDIPLCAPSSCPHPKSNPYFLPYIPPVNCSLHFFWPITFPVSRGSRQSGNSPFCVFFSVQFIFSCSMHVIIRCTREVTGRSRCDCDITKDACIQSQSYTCSRFDCDVTNNTFPTQPTGNPKLTPGRIILARCGHHLM